MRMQVTAKTPGFLCLLLPMFLLVSCSEKQAGLRDAKPEIELHFQLSKTGVIRFSATSHSSVPLVEGKESVVHNHGALKVIYGEGALKDIPTGYEYYDKDDQVRGKAQVWFSKDEANNDWLLNGENTYRGNIEIELAVEKPDGTAPNIRFGLPQGSMKRSCWRK